MKETQYTRIIKALRQAGKRGCTTRELMLVGSNCPWKRIAEMTYWNDAVCGKYGGKWTVSGNPKERIERGTRIVNSRAVRVYRLVRA